ncbi:acyltransferase family protein [Wocania ichthyoenteri]|uniref:acyltransferase family protein n=1 Tax=Wocania ichthyoenteri TaxID=1230531 RepID=UPI00053CFE7D|nr:acyltransferase [Wocania ichthyoenteri]
MLRKHFHTFDALRFFSFLLVFLLHLPKTGNPYIDFFLKSGGIGVSFFFVLSGFLITYIILYEKGNTNRVSLKNFFARRILRIWPLFYAMIFFAFASQYVIDAFNIPHNNEGYDPNLLVSMLFGENYKMMLSGTFPDGAPLRVMWSLCVEEHFYILWGISLYLISVKKIPYLIICSIVIANITRLVYSYFDIASLDVFSNIDYFAFGAIPAYIFLYKEGLINRLGKFPLYLKYTAFFITIAVVFTIPNLSSSTLNYFSPSILGILFSITLLFTLGANSIHIKDDFWVSKLGAYTYGLYLYHSIVILFFIQFSNYFNVNLSWAVLAVVTLLITIIISSASYHIFEKQFLKLKKHFY